MTDERPMAESLLTQARSGDQAALGRLLELYRNYLRFVSRSLIDTALRLRADASDVVQETFLEAFRDFEQFAGGSEAELIAWLRKILVRNLADQIKRHGAKVRDWHRQESLEAMLDRSSVAIHQALAAGISTPSAQASRREQSVLLADAMERLPDDYRQVIMLRNVEGLKFEEVAARMGRKSGAVRMLWTRALERLANEMGTSHEK